MKTKLTFPVKRFKYYDTYCCSIKVNFELMGAEVILDPGLQYHAPGVFYFKINDKLALADFSDFYDEWNWDFDNTGYKHLNKMYDYDQVNVPIFKRTMTVGEEYPNHVFPLGPYFVDNNKSPKDLQFLLSLGNIYNPEKGNGVFHSNRMYGAGGVLTRKKAFNQIDQSKLLPEVRFIKQRVSQYQFWKNHANCVSTLNISGSAWHSQDKNPVEAMFLGVCGVSNNFDIYLPCDEKIDHTQHYICLNDEFSDINEKLNYVHENRAEAKDIGANAYELMMRTCTPEKRVNWMTEVVENYYQ